MKKILYSLMALAVAAFTFTSCEDVPAPYNLPGTGGGNTGTETKGSLPYTSESLYKGWTTQAINGKGNPWSQGSSYTQATGYQKWDGAETKSNRETEGLLVSPAFTTTAESGKVKMSYEYCVGYANNDSKFADHIKAYISCTYTDGDIDLADWKAIDWKATHTSTDWTLKLEEVQIPDEFVNVENVHIAFWFYSPADKSATFELKTFTLEEGEAATPDNPETPQTESSDENPLSVVQAQTVSGNQYVKGYIVGYVDGTKLDGGVVFAVPTVAETEILIADNPDETTVANVMPVQLPNGDIRNGLELFAHPEYLKKEVVLYGSVETYFGVPGLKSTSWAKIDGKEIGKKPGDNTEPEIPGDPKGNGTLDNPFNVAAAIAKAIETGTTATSEVYYVEGIVSSLDSKYANTFSISDDGSQNNEFKFYNGTGIGETTLQTGDVKIGDKVVICGKIVNYYGNTPEMEKGCTIISINGKSEPSTSETPDTPNVPSGENILANGDFESWTGDQPTNWKSTCSASSATLKQSTDAHGGSYSVNVNGNATNNKRIAYKETALDVGTYVFSFWVKATSGNVAQVRPGYVPVKDGSVGTYAYGDYCNISTEWSQCVHEFTISEPTTVCLVVMNPKASNYSSGEDVLIDDASLIKK